jgi:hypothetical protein
MAKVFGAVASGAGLVSLALQLIDTAQKLKKLYNTSRDAPTTVADLCFELETMSLSPRQLNSHRSANIAGDELLGRSADAFINFMQPCDASRLATAQDSQARTALHWAAKHLGYWAGVWWSRDICPDDAKAKSYAKLATELLKMGSNTHAVSALHETPLMTILHQLMTFVDWSVCATAVRRWGDILVEAALDLDEYVHAENPLLWSLAEERRATRVWDGERYYILRPAETRLMVTRGSILAVQINFCRPVSI